MGSRKGRFEAEAKGSRAVAVLTRISPFMHGKKFREADYIMRHGGRVEEQIYKDFQQRFLLFEEIAGKRWLGEMVLRSRRLSHEPHHHEVRQQIAKTIGRKIGEDREQDDFDLSSQRSPRTIARQTEAGTGFGKLYHLLRSSALTY